MKRLDLLVVYEYGPSADFMFEDLLNSLERNREGLSIRFLSGLYQEYVPGGV